MSAAPTIKILGILLVALCIGCGRERDAAVPSESGIAPSTTAGELRLGDHAQEAIGLTTTAAESRDVRETMTSTGWLAPRPASELVVKAPTTGFIVPQNGNLDALGKPIAKDQHLADVEAFLSPQDQAQLVAIKEDAARDLQQAQDTLKLNEEQLQRAEAAGPTAVAGTRLLELREIVAHARAAEDAARKKLPFLPEGSYDNVHLKSIAITAPLEGQLLNVHFVPRQLVVAGDPLWTIADWSRLWIRVPVYAGDLSRIVQGDPIDVVVPGGNVVRQAQPVHVPQATDSGKQTVELLYEIENKPGGLRPGQAVSVSLPTDARAPAIIIPRSAILWDGMGNSWVYRKTSPTSFHRQKVEVGQPVEDNIAVSRGLSKGDIVVTGGAEALYGEEFKGQIHLEEEGERD